MKRVFAFTFIFCLLTINTKLYAQCINGNCTDGIGMYKAGNGNIYEGQFKNGIPHGNGRLVRSNGAVYEGQFKYGAFDGAGTLYDADSTIYRGQFRQGVKQGKGELLYANGKKLNGMFRNNEPADEKDDHAEQLNFYTCDLNVSHNLYDYDGNRKLTGFDFDKNLVYIDTVTFDLTTGKLLPDQKPPKVVIKDQAYTLIPAHVYAYYQLLSKTRDVITPKLQYTGNGYLIMSGRNSQDNKDNFIVYKIAVPSGKAEKISFFKNVSYIDPYNVDHTVSRDGKILYHANSGEIYTDGGKKKVVLSDFVEKQPTPFNWFSAAGDTLYRLGNDLTIRAYDSATGKLLRKDSYTSNRVLPVAGRYQKIVAFSPEQKRLILMFDNYKIDQQLGLAEDNFRKAVVLDLNDPDYMLPLVNPVYTRDYYADRVRAGLKSYLELQAYQAQRAAEAAKKYGWDKKTPAKITSILLEDDGYTYRKPVIKPKSSGSKAGVCIWCGGSGKVTSKDVYDKGYNTTYSSTGAWASQRSVGGSTSTSVCMACHGTGH